MSLELRRRLKFARSKFDRLRRPAGRGIQQHEYRVYSQHREDGIIHHILNTAGVKSNRFVEFGFGPLQANCHNLLYHYGYHGLYMDGNREKCDLMAEYFARRFPESRVEHLFITRDNLCETISAAGFDGELAVLSIDVDGNDYWFWECITCCDPALVVIEYNASLGPNQDITVPYDPGFVRYEKHQSGLYHGASLGALTRLGGRKGYALLGVDSSGVNAFFLKRELLCGALIERKAAEVFLPHRSRTRYKGLSQARQWELVSDMPYKTV